MMDPRGTLVAVRQLDKQLLIGWTRDFRPNRDRFHIEEQGADSATEVELKDLKAVFFLKTSGGDSRNVAKRSYDDRTGTEKKVWIEFHDGERLAAWSNSYASPTAGFYVFPADPDSNMEKAYVFHAAVGRLEHNEAAEEAAREFRSASQAAVPSTPQASQSRDDDAGSYRWVRPPRGSSGKRAENE